MSEVVEREREREKMLMIFNAGNALVIIVQRPRLTGQSGQGDVDFAPATSL